MSSGCEMLWIILSAYYCFPVSFPLHFTSSPCNSCSLLYSFLSTHFLLLDLFPYFFLLVFQVNRIHLCDATYLPASASSCPTSCSLFHLFFCLKAKCRRGKAGGGTRWRGLCKSPVAPVMWCGLHIGISNWIWMACFSWAWGKSNGEGVMDLAQKLHTARY